jgi:ribosomal protein S18 acetylase RimI-like enzyme
LVNDSYSNPAINSVEYTSDRLKSNRQLVEELGERGFTVVAFDSSLPVGEEERESAGKLVGTASVKNWIDDGLWVPATAPDSQVRDGVSAPCPGDLEVTVVAVRHGIEYRKRGIAERLVRECESEIVRRLKQQDEAHYQSGSSHVKVMLKVVKEINGLYWSKKGFVVVGQRFCPTGTWDSTRDFTLWAMTRDVSVDS